MPRWTRRLRRTSSAVTTCFRSTTSVSLGWTRALLSAACTTPRGRFRPCASAQAPVRDAPAADDSGSSRPTLGQRSLREGGAGTPGCSRSQRAGSRLELKASAGGHHRRPAHVDGGDDLFRVDPLQVPRFCRDVRHVPEPDAGSRSGVCPGRAFSDVSLRLKSRCCDSSWLLWKVAGSSRERASTVTSGCVFSGVQTGVHSGPCLTPSLS
jgi:hypothetical protein